MPNLEDQRTVLELACLTEDRDPKEHDAMLRVAERIEREWNRQTVTNKPERWQHPVALVWLVDNTVDTNEWTKHQRQRRSTRMDERRQAERNRRGA